VGRNHLREISALVQRYNPRAPGSWGDGGGGFLLESGGEQIARWFGDVRMHRYEDDLHITEAGPLVDYIASMITLSAFVRGTLDDFHTFVEREIARQGPIRVTKDSGLFEAVRPGG
jgi:hypothetical protein